MRILHGPVLLMLLWGGPIWAQDAFDELAEPREPTRPTQNAFALRASTFPQLFNKAAKAHGLSVQAKEDRSSHSIARYTISPSTSVRVSLDRSLGTIRSVSVIGARRGESLSDEFIQVVSLVISVFTTSLNEEEHARILSSLGLTRHAMPGDSSHSVEKNNIRFRAWTNSQGLRDYFSLSRASSRSQSGLQQLVKARRPAAVANSPVTEIPPEESATRLNRPVNSMKTEVADSTEKNAARDSNAISDDTDKSDFESAPPPVNKAPTVKQPTQNPSNPNPPHRHSNSSIGKSARRMCRSNSSSRIANRVPRISGVPSVPSFGGLPYSGLANGVLGKLTNSRRPTRQRARDQSSNDGERWATQKDTSVSEPGPTVDDLSRQYYSQLMQADFTDLAQAYLSVPYGSNEYGIVMWALNKRMPAASKAELLAVTDRLMPADGLYNMLYNQLIFRGVDAIQRIATNDLIRYRSLTSDGWKIKLDRELIARLPKLTSEEIDQLLSELSPLDRIRIPLMREQQHRGTTH